MFSLEMIGAFREELEKLSKVHTKLQPHQTRVVDRIQQADQPGLVVAHGLGSGKTLTSIAAQDALGMESDVIVPAALRANYRKEMKKHVTGKKQKTNIDSLQNVAVKGKVPKNEMLIVDEAHRLRDPASKGYQTVKKTEAKKRLLLTGSPFYNHPADIAPLVNVAAGSKVLPEQRADFENAYVFNQKISPGVLGMLRGVRSGNIQSLNPATQEELSAHLQKWVDYHEGTKDHFPDVEREDVKVEMNPDQQHMYDSLMGRAPAWVRYKVKKGLPPTKQESKQLNAFLGAARQVSNTTGPFRTVGDIHDPKVERAFQELKKNLDANPRSKAVVYSNFLEAGIEPYKKRLDKAGIPYGEFTGQMNKKKRDELVQQYNDNKIRALLLSSAGGEGLDLKGTRLMQVLEPHWNDEKLHQVEGRGIRYKSHDDLPAEERNVKIQRFLATRPRTGLLEKLRLAKPGLGVDEYLTSLSEQKGRLNEQFRGLLKKPYKKVPGQS